MAQVASKISKTNNCRSFGCVGLQGLRGEFDKGDGVAGSLAGGRLVSVCMWRSPEKYPKLVVPPNYPCDLIGFSSINNINHPFWATPNGNLLRCHEDAWPGAATARWHGNTLASTNFPMRIRCKSIALHVFLASVSRTR